MRIMHTVAFLLLIIGGLNWGLVGLFNANVVGWIFGGADRPITRLIFVLVGLAAIYLLTQYRSLASKA